ncbi:hypothetical protein ACXYMP_15875 [Aliiroseovarius sp. CAU 1755]
MTRNPLSSAGEHSPQHCASCGCPLVLTRGDMANLMRVIAKPGNLERLKRLLDADGQWDAICPDQPGGPNNV